MIAALTEFLQRIKYVHEKLDAIKTEESLVSTARSNVGDNLCEEIKALLDFYKRSRTRKKQYDYVLVIIALYGAFERFLEDAIDEYVEILTSVYPTYGLLPGKVRDGHVQLSFESIRYAKSDTRHQVERDLVRRLYRCYDDRPGYELHSKAFSYHTANFKVAIINDTFSKLDIQSICKDVVQDRDYKSYLEAELGFSDLDNRPLLELIGFIDDLAERRNEVAHGGLPSALLSTDDLSKMAHALEMFVSTAAVVLRKKCIGMCTDHLAIKIGKAISCYGDNVVCFNLQKDFSVKCGQFLIATSNNTAVDCGVIQEIQVDHVSYAFISTTHALDVGLKVDMKVKMSYNYYLIELTPAILVLSHKINMPCH